MINYRNLFNPSYNYIGLIIIIIISLLIIIIQKDTIKSIQQISKTCLIASLTILIITILLNLLMNGLIPNSYKVFIEIISKNVIKNLYFYSILLIIISSIMNILTKILTKPKISS